MNILSLIASDSFIMTSKPLIKVYGLFEANIIGLFASVANYTMQNSPESDGWFYVTYDKIEEELCISKHIASNAIENLIKAKILIDKKAGVPCRRLFKFQEVEIFNSLKLKILTTGSQKNELQGVKYSDDKQLNASATSGQDNERQAVKNLNRNKNINKNINNISLGELEKIKKYFSENNFRSDPEDFWNYWEKKGWKDGKSKITNRQAAAKDWERKFKKMNPEQNIAASKGESPIIVAKLTKEEEEFLIPKTTDPFWIELRPMLIDKMARSNGEGSWGDNLCYHGVRNDKQQFSVPSKFLRDWIRREYYSVFDELCGVGCWFVFSLQD